VPFKKNPSTDEFFIKTDKNSDLASVTSNKVIENVMIVDDSATMRKILRSLLEKIGIKNVIEAVNGLQGIKKLGEHRVDMIIADWLMPKMNGALMIKEIRKNPDYDNIPIVLVSAEYGEKIDRAIKAGANGYINKPFSIKELKALLSKFIPTI